MQGTYTDKNGSSLCHLCPFATFSAGGSIICIPCGKNYNTTSNARTTVQDCKELCSTGQAGYNGVQPCFPCQAGSFATSLGTKCTPREIESVSVWNNSEVISIGNQSGSCVLTRSNDTDTLVASGCLNCNSGFFQSSSGRSVCDICAFSTYASSGATVCKNCPIGAVTLNQGSQSLNDCLLACKSGYYSSNGQQPCSICFPGKYSLFQDNRNFGSTVCILCPPGTYMPSYGASLCYFCPPGKSTILSGTTTVESCHGNVSKSVCLQVSRFSVQVAPQYTIFDENSSIQGYYLNEDVPPIQSAEIIIMNGGSGYINGELAAYSSLGDQLLVNGSFLAKNGKIYSASLNSFLNEYTEGIKLDILYNKTGRRMTSSITAIEINLSQMLTSCSEGEIYARQNSTGTDIPVAIFTCRTNGCTSTIIDHGEGFEYPVIFRVITSNTTLTECRCGSKIQEIVKFSLLELTDTNQSLQNALGTIPINGVATVDCQNQECSGVGFGHNFSGVCNYNGSEIISVEVLNGGEGFSDAFLPKISCKFNASDSSLVQIPIQVKEALVGESLENYGNYYSCIDFVIAQNADLVVSPLDSLQRKLVCENDDGNGKNCSVLLNQSTFNNDRLYSWMVLSTGYSVIEFLNFECVSVGGIVLSSGADNVKRRFGRALICAGQTQLWNTFLNLSIILMEVLLVNDIHTVSGIQMHIALYFSDHRPEVWSILVNNIPVLEGASSSWLRSVNTSSPHAVVKGILFQASSIGFEINASVLPWWSNEFAFSSSYQVRRGVAILMVGGGFLAEFQPLKSDQETKSNEANSFNVSVQNTSYEIVFNQSSAAEQYGYGFFGLERMLPKVRQFSFL